MTSYATYLKLYRALTPLVIQNREEWNAAYVPLAEWNKQLTEPERLRLIAEAIELGIQATGYESYKAAAEQLERTVMTPETWIGWRECQRQAERDFLKECFLRQTISKALYQVPEDTLRRYRDERMSNTYFKLKKILAYLPHGLGKKVSTDVLDSLVRDHIVRRLTPVKGGV